MQTGRQINERKRAEQLRHLEALLVYVEAGEPCDMQLTPPLHLVGEGPVVLTVELDRDAFLGRLAVEF